MTQPLHPQRWVKIWARVVDPYPNLHNEITVQVMTCAEPYESWETVNIHVDLIPDQGTTTDVVDGLVEVQLGEYAEKAAEHD